MSLFNEHINIFKAIPIPRKLHSIYLLHLDMDMIEMQLKGGSNEFPQR